VLLDRRAYSVALTLTDARMDVFRMLPRMPFAFLFGSMSACRRCTALRQQVHHEAPDHHAGGVGVYRCLHVHGLTGRQRAAVSEASAAATFGLPHVHQEQHLYV
jgi:hypothetical protein